MAFKNIILVGVGVPKYESTDGNVANDSIG